MAKKAPKEIKEGDVPEIKVVKSAFDLAVEELNKKYGAGSVSGANTVSEVLEVVDTGSLYLNAALECGGWPVGKMVELQGPESSSKSTLTLHAIANFQQKFPNKKVLLVDFEHAFDSGYAKSIGVDIDKLYIAQPGFAEEGYNTIVSLIRSGELSLVIVDSHTAGKPKVIIDGEVGSHTIGLEARVNGIAVAKIKPLLKPFGCTLIAISQLRTKFGQFATSQSSTSGNSWKFYSDIRIKMYRTVDKEKALDKTELEIIKNKCGKPYNKINLNVIWGKGLDRIGEVIKIACDAGHIKVGGSWFTLDEDLKFQGIDKVRQFMVDNPEYFKELEGKVIGNIQIETIEPDADSVD